MLGSGIFIKGMIAGFAMAAPIGPIGLLCMRRSLVNGVTSGLSTGLGAATADSIYGAIAVFGLTAVSGLLEQHAVFLRLAGGVLLLVLAARIFLAQDHPSSVSGNVEKEPRDLRHDIADFVSTFVLTLTNPVTVIAFMAVFAALGIGLYSREEEGSTGHAVVAVCGVFIGSLAWWCTLTYGVGLFRERLGAGGLRVINKLSAFMLAGFGVLVLGYLAVFGH